jgi:hypothetical protein
MGCDGGISLGGGLEVRESIRTKDSNEAGGKEKGNSKLYFVRYQTKAKQSQHNEFQGIQRKFEPVAM